MNRFDFGRVGDPALAWEFALAQEEQDEIGTQAEPPFAMLVIGSVVDAGPQDVVELLLGWDYGD